MADAKTIRGLTVIGRERVFDALRHLRPSDAGDLDERVSTDLGRQLRATWLVSGGYQRLGEQIRITARVSDRAARNLTESCRHLPALNRARARVDQDFDPIRADQRFAALLETGPRQQ